MDAKLIRRALILLTVVTATGVNPAVGNFGVVTGTRDARVLQLALKLTY